MQELNIIGNFRTLFHYYKSLGEKAMAQINEEALFWRPNLNSNSIAIIAQHLSGNMCSRFTDFLSSDGEKPWRNRDGEFEAFIATQIQLHEEWERGWTCLFSALDALTDTDLNKQVFIRSQAHSVFEALQRQLAHYASHVGQIIYIAKSVADQDWQSLSIPRGQSEAFNQQTSAEGHFTDGVLKKN